MTNKLLENYNSFISKFIGYGFHDRHEDEKEIFEQYSGMLKEDFFKDEFILFCEICQCMLRDDSLKDSLIETIIKSLEFYRSFENRSDAIIWLNKFIESCKDNLT